MYRSSELSQSRLPESNRWHTGYKSVVLPTELNRLIRGISKKGSLNETKKERTPRTTVYGSHFAEHRKLCNDSDRNWTGVASLKGMCLILSTTEPCAVYMGCPPTFKAHTVSNTHIIFIFAGQWPLVLPAIRELPGLIGMTGLEPICWIVLLRSLYSSSAHLTSCILEKSLFPGSLYH